MYQSKCPDCGKAIAAGGTQCPACRSPVAAEPNRDREAAPRAPAAKLTTQQLLIAQLCGLGAVLMFAGSATHFWGEVILLAGVGGFLATRLRPR